MAESIDESTRAGRFASIRKALGVTGERYAEMLNDAAEDIGLARYWTGPKVTNTEKGKRAVSLEDAIVVEHVDPKGRGFTWIAFGVPTRKGKDAWSVLAEYHRRQREA